ncbi:hypothetical protein ACFFK0_19945 [Paenibacillus chartarius]|uniref:Flp pilus-assembly TadG-like N-terminal domain-containing protein n=1 Tax=Paenibacillus chartarius TaxID=747481 RepID=A0ABV6DPX6_9BACL
MSILNRSGERGSVSVYLIIVIVPIFLFVTVLIDFVRIGAADRETELAVKAGVRSAMSAFDSKLQPYGLYGLTVPEEDAQQLFATAASGSVSAAERPGGYIDTMIRPGSVKLQPMATLAYPDVFKQQVLEEMKYRAPIEFTLEIADKLKNTGMASSLTQGKTFSEDATRLEALIVRREDALDEAWDVFERLHHVLLAEHATNGRRLRELNNLANRVGLNTVDQVRSSITQLQAQAESLRQSMSGLDSSIAAAAAAGQAGEALRSLFEARAALARQLQDILTQKGELEQLLQLLLQYAALIVTIRTEAAAAAAQIHPLQTAFNQSLSEAKQANDSLRTEWNRINGETSGTSASGSGNGNAETSFGAVRVLPDEFFTEFQTDTASLVALFHAYASDIEAAVSYADSQTAVYESKNDAYAAKSNAVYQARLPMEQQRKERNDKVKARKQKLWDEIDDVLQRARQAIGGCPVVPGADNGAYDKLQASVVKYEHAGETPSAGEAVVELNNSKRIGADALNLGGLIAEALEGARDSTYINEYALTKFNYRTFGLEKLPNGQPKPTAALTEPQSHVLGAQEAEYVLYGFPTCTANISAAYGEIFAIRLAIRTLERLTDPKTELLQLGSPLLMLLAAAAQGAVEALQDMSRLVMGQEVQLSTKFAAAVSMNYKDYLRLLLFVHGGTERKLQRIQALIELNTGVDLTKASTQVNGRAETTVKLWFLPGSVRLLGLTGMSPCRVEGSRCVLQRNATWTY